MKTKLTLLAALCGFTTAAFAASESFDVGVDLRSLVSRDYFERRPFKFDWEINVQLK